MMDILLLVLGIYIFSAIATFVFIFSNRQQTEYYRQMRVRTFIPIINTIMFFSMTIGLVLNIFDRIKNKRQIQIHDETEIAMNCQDEDNEVLQAEPILRKRMILTWFEPDELAQLKGLLSGNNSVTVGMDNGSGENSQQYEITIEDYKWAKELQPIIDKASAAAQNAKFSKAIEFYKDALELAPGCDMFLMSIGSCYGNLHNKDKAVRYLQRALQISPRNKRIQENLAYAHKI